MTQTLDNLNKADTGADAREVAITRTFDAPRALVFQAWTDPEQLKRWYAPNDCTIDIVKLDFRVGGEIHTCIRNPKFGDCWCKGVYTEIDAPKQFVQTMSFSNEQGDFVEPAAMGMKADWPRETTLTVTFHEEDGKTTVHLYQTVRETLAKSTGAYSSWHEMLDRLDNILPNKSEITN